jgi:hypothetical protein
VGGVDGAIVGGAGVSVLAGSVGGGLVGATVGGASVAAGAAVIASVAAGAAVIASVAAGAPVVAAPPEQALAIRAIATNRLNWTSHMFLTRISFHQIIPDCLNEPNEHTQVAP